VIQSTGEAIDGLS